jgi:hypothetical protein
MGVFIHRPGQRIWTPGSMGVQYVTPRGAAAAGNGLLNALIAYWPGNEASGNLLDAHTNDLDLTDTNTVTNATGKVYATARQYTTVGTAFEYHTRAGDDALLSAGDVDFTLAVWVYFDTVGTVSKWIANKRTSGASAAGYQLAYSGSDVGGPDRLRFAVFIGGAGKGVGAVQPSVDTWYLVVGWHDSVANTINIQVNNGTVDSESYADGCGDDTGPFRIGGPSFTSTAYYMAGRIGPTMFWKSAAGEGGVLSTAQRTALWNSGNGLTYAAFET